MDEIFDVIRAFNHLKDQVETLNIRLDRLIKNPSVLLTKRIVDEQAAASLLNLSVRELQRIRKEGKIQYIVHKRRINYSLKAINQYIEKHTCSPSEPFDTTKHANTRQ